MGGLQTLAKQELILVIDDDSQTRKLVSRCLERSNFMVKTAESGADALESIAANSFDLAIIDLLLPDTHGLDLTRAIKSSSDMAVIILSGVSDTIDKVVGLELGADDYIVKPFEPRELVARVRSVLRRVSDKKPPVVSNNRCFGFADWVIDIDSRSLTNPNGEDIALTSGEFDLLAALVQHPGKVLTRNHIMNLIYGHATPAFDRSIDVRIGRLRKKTELDPKSPILIKTVRNVGYIFTAKVEQITD